MRRMSMGVAFVAITCLAFAGWAIPRGDLQAQQPGVPAVKPLVLAEGMIALSSDTADGRQQVTVIDTKARAMSVYHIEHQTGRIVLKSARDLAADLMLEEFNTDSPLPREIRAMINKR